jgi:hypothetical protein
VVFPPKKIDQATAGRLIEDTVAEIRAGGLTDIEAMRLRLTAGLDARGVSARDGFRVLYVAILGTPTGVPVFDAMAFIGAEACVQRLLDALGELERRGEPKSQP